MNLRFKRCWVAQYKDTGDGFLGAGYSSTMGQEHEWDPWDF